MSRRNGNRPVIRMLVCLAMFLAIVEQAVSQPASSSASQPAAEGTRPTTVDGAPLSSPTVPANEGLPAVQDESPSHAKPASGHSPPQVDFFTMLFVLLLATFVGVGVIGRVSRLLHTPLMSLTNAISAIAVVGAIIVTGGDYPLGIRILGFIALVASTTNIVSGFLITDRMLKMFKSPRQEGQR